jgi:putative transposase
VLTDFSLRIAPSTYYAAITRPLSARAVRDEQLKKDIVRVYEENYSVYGEQKVWWALNREGIVVGRCRVERLMRALGLVGAVRGKKVRTTVSDPDAARAPDLVKRQFAAGAPNRLWMADFTYVSTWAGTVYTAFAIDVFSRRIVGWTTSMSKETGLVLDTIEMGLRVRDYREQDGEGKLIHHSDAGSQYTSFRFTQHLIDSGVDASIGTVGDALEVSRRRESHPPPLAEPCVKVSLHTAPTVEPVGIAPCRQWANIPGNADAISASFRRVFPLARRNRLYFRIAHFTRKGLMRCSRKFINLDL